MRRTLASVVAAAFAFGAVGLVGYVLAAPVPKEKGKVKDEDAIQGTWKVETFDLGGAAGGPPPGEVTKLKLTFKDGKVAADRGDGKPDAIDYKIDPSTTPKSLDLIEKSNPMLAIYELEGDTLKICVSEGGAKGVRPAEMKSDGKNVAVITLKRVKEDKDEKDK